MCDYINFTIKSVFSLCCKSFGIISRGQYGFMASLYEKKFVRRLTVAKYETVSYLGFVKRQTTFDNQSLFTTDKRQTKPNIFKHLGI